MAGHLWDNQIYVDDNALSININRNRDKLSSIGLTDVGRILRTFKIKKNVEVTGNGKQAQGLTEKLKAENALEWTGRMNSIRACAREIVNEEIINI